MKRERIECVAFSTFKCNSTTERMLITCFFHSPVQRTPLKTVVGFRVYNVECCFRRSRNFVGNETKLARNNKKGGLIINSMKFVDNRYSKSVISQAFESLFLFFDKVFKA